MKLALNLLALTLPAANAVNTLGPRVPKSVPAS